LDTLAGIDTGVAAHLADPEHIDCIRSLVGRVVVVSTAALDLSERSLWECPGRSSGSGAIGRIRSSRLVEVAEAQTGADIVPRQVLESALLPVCPFVDSSKFTPSV
jgi:hypothetical protein